MKLPDYMKASPAEPVEPNYTIDFESAAASAKRLLRGCSKRSKDDLVHLHHAFLQIEQYLLDQAICDPLIKPAVRQAQMTIILSNLAYIKLMVTTRPKSLFKFPEVQAELKPFFELRRKKANILPDSHQSS